MKNNTWYQVKNQSLAIYARRAGFDLAMYKDYDDAVQLKLRARAVTEAMKSILTSAVRTLIFTFRAPHGTTKGAFRY